MAPSVASYPGLRLATADNSRSVVREFDFGSGLDFGYGDVPAVLPETIARGGSWWEFTVSPGTVKVELRTMPGGEKGAAPDNGAQHYDMLPDPIRTHLEAFDPYTERGRITAWSYRSRARMLYRLASIDWEKCSGIAEMVTLTYPSEFPLDGETCKAHLQAFRKRYERRWGPAQGAWKLEFQRRGAPHFHVLLYRPVDSEFRVFTRWVSRAWYHIVGSNDPRHLRAGTGVDRETFRRAGKKATARRIAHYFAKHAGPGRTGTKSYQNEVPDAFANCGRFWGIWGVSPAEVTVPVTREDAVQLRRFVRSYRRSQNRRASSASTVRTWSLVDSPGAFVVQVTRWCRGPEVLHRTPTGRSVVWPPGKRRPLP